VTSPPPADPPIIGREYELDLIESFIADADQGGALILCGEAGVGKSVLLRAGAAAAARHGVNTLWAAGVEFDTEVSFSGLSQILAPLHDRIGGLDDLYCQALTVVLGLGSGATPRPLVVANAVLSLLSSHAERQAVLVLVDDIQWLDRASAVVLAFIARRVAGRRICILGATRTRFDIAEQAGLRQHDIDPLSSAASAHLIETHFPGLSARCHRRLLDEAQGNPLALLELTAAQQNPRGPVLNPVDGALPLSRRLQTLFAHRIRALPAPTRELLLLAALHSPAEFTVLTDAAPHLALSSLEPAEQDRLVAVHDNAHVVFHHPLIRATIVELANDLDRRRAHYALASVLNHLPERRAWHLAAASIEPNERVATLLEDTAAINLTRGDAVGAVAALTRSAELSPDPHRRGRRLIAAASLSANVTGELRTANQLLESALGTEPDLTDSLHATVVTCFILLNAECDVTTARQLLVSAITKHPDRCNASDEVLIEALHALLMMCWMSADPDVWPAFDAAMGRLNPNVPHSLLLCRSTFGDPARDAVGVIDLFDCAISALRGEYNPVAVTRMGIASVYVDRLAQCREPLQRVIDDGRGAGAVALAINATVTRCVDTWLTGQWDEADALASEGTALAARHGYRRYSFVLGGYIKSLVATVRGDTQAGLAAADELSEWAAATGSAISDVFAHHLRALAALAVGDHDTAFHNAAAISPAGVLAPFAPHALWVLLDLVEAAVGSDRPAAAAAHVDAMQRANLAAISPRLALIVAGSAAIAAPAQDANPLFEAAVAIPGAARWPFELARIHLAYGQHLRASTLIAESVVQLSSALELFEQLATVPWAMRTAQLLRHNGVSRYRTNPAETAALSELDLRIATLAASGLSNRQIADQVNLSHRTVGAHLYRIFPELGITSRAALHEALLAQRDGASPAD
jgi:DNA-binding CsgD family transcriptional regulator